MNKFPSLCSQTYPNAPTQYFIDLPIDPENTKKKKRFYLGQRGKAKETHKALKSLYDDWELTKIQIAQLLMTGAHKKGKRALLKAAEALVDNPSYLPPTPPPTDNHPNGILLVELFRQFIMAKKGIWRERAGAGGTKDKYKRMIKKKLAAYRGLRVKEFTRDVFVEWRDGLVGMGLKRGTVNSYCLCLKGVFKWGAENNLVPPETLAALQTVKLLEAGETPAPEADERTSVQRAVVEATLKELTDRPKTVIQLLLLTACRPEEILSLRLDRINKTDPDIWWYEPEHHKNKRFGLDRFIPLNKEAQRLILDYIERNGIKGPYVFPSAAREGKIHTLNDYYSPRSLDAAIKKAVKRAGVQRWSAYQIRHLIATELIAQGRIQEAQFLLGHANYSTTEKYYFDAIQKLKKAKSAVQGLSLTGLQEDKPNP